MTTATKMRNTRTSSLTRRLGAFEHLIWSTDQWTPRHFVLVARIEGGPISIERLEDAFCAVQRRHPALRTAIDVDSDGTPRFVPSESKIEADLVADEAVVRDDLAKVISFMDKPADGFYLPLDMRGTQFQRRVWEKLRAIPVGKTVTYTDVAYWVGPLTSARAVAGACASNPIALAVPCHRVVCSSGDLAGYRWGVARKREMIRREAMA